MGIVIYKINKTAKIGKTFLDRDISHNEFKQLVCEETA